MDVPSSHARAGEGTHWKIFRFTHLRQPASTASGWVTKTIFFTGLPAIDMLAYEWRIAAEYSPERSTRMILRLLSISLLLALGLAHPASAEEPHHIHNRYGNPADLDRYIDMLMDPGRHAWQQPERVVKALGLKPGRTACDIGAGPGYFSLRLARVVGESGRVFAVDVEPRILAELRNNIDRSGARNITPVLGLAGHSLLPEGACDVILIVNTYHHFPDPPDYLQRLAHVLKDGGRVVNIDFRKDADFGPPPSHRIARGDFLGQARDAGYVMEREEKFLEQQYFIVLRPEE